ncbi:MAG: YkgJ family cysteine cluster protein [Bacteroidales bacterium]
MPDDCTCLIDPGKIIVAAKLKYKENQRFLRKMKSLNPQELDNVAHQLHEEVFRYTDCLACANCCKSISPAMRERDVERIASSLHLKPSEVVVKYMHLDTDGDYVFNAAPCPFLDQDNRCKVYDDRPKACREYPHTNRRKFSQLLELTLKNTAVCPAVFSIVEKMKNTLG